MGDISFLIKAMINPMARGIENHPNPSIRGFLKYSTWIKQPGVPYGSVFLLP
jgi:hypothetical protein